MNHIQRLLLLELEPMPSTPERLRVALADWEHNVTNEVVVDHLRVLEAEGLVSGPGISRLHHQRVWLTAAGRQQLKNLGDNFGLWRRIGVSPDNAEPGPLRTELAPAGGGALMSDQQSQSASNSAYTRNKS
jgi:hypothetical protein